MHNRCVCNPASLHQENSTSLTLLYRPQGQRQVILQEALNNPIPPTAQAERYEGIVTGAGLTGSEHKVGDRDTAYSHQHAYPVKPFNPVMYSRRQYPGSGPDYDCQDEGC